MEKAVTHLREAFRWSTAAGAERMEPLAAGIGMAAPVFAGATTGHPGAGLIAAVGAMAMSGASPSANRRAQARRLGEIFLVVLAAALAAAIAARHGKMTDVIIMAFAATAAVIGGYSRSLVEATMRFILYVVLVSGIAATTADQRAAMVMLVGAGALWAGLLAFVFASASRAIVPAPRQAQQIDRAQKPEPTASQKFARWKRSLRQLAGWQYTLRLLLCLSAATLLKWLFPSHHLHWVTLTVALLLHRQAETLPLKVTQRALGVAAGIGVAMAPLFLGLPAWAMTLFIGILAGARPVLRNRNYLAYSVVATALIILAMEANRPPSAAILADRLVATLIGASLVIVANWGATRLLRSTE
ncbi:MULTISPECIES: FUSC family protein [unclassified Sinorhizobium]|uniref:FUSC family protein n=1 Tax=unclassified Sinorhizobium TaxID=2613772 RepID=UPI0035233A41